MSRRSQMLFSFLASLAVHLLALIVAVVLISFSGLFPPEEVRATAPNEVVIYLPEVLPGKPAEPETEPQGTPYIDTHERSRSENAPARPDFESDKNTLAASEGASDPQGLPLPAQEGLKDMPFIQLNDREYTDGEEANERASAARPGGVPAVAMVTPPSPLDPAPVEIREKAEPVAETSSRPPDSEPMEDRFSDALDIIAVRKPSQETPEKTEDPEEDPAAALAARMAETLPRLEETPPLPPQPETAAAGQPGETGFKPHTRRTDMAGSLSNRGDASVNAAATPLGQYKKQVSDAIGKLWHRYRQDRADFVEYGSIKLSFEVDRNGKTRDLKILRADANAVMVDFTLSAILRADIPPMPVEILDILDNDALEVTYDVIIY